MRLQSLVPALPQALLNALADCNIRTDTDLLFSGSPTDIFRNLPQGTVDLQDFLDVVAQVTAQAAAPAVRGDQLLDITQKRRQENVNSELSSGVPELDALLGGLRPPRVLEVSGDRGSGKTAFALQVVLRHLSTVYDSGALWIDTTGDLSPERIPVLLNSYAGEAAPTVLERLQVALAFDIEAAHDVLEELRASLSMDPPLGPVVRLVVIDTITPLLGPLLSAVSSQGHAIMTTFMRQLRVLADTFSLTILVLNSTSQASPRNLDAAFLSNRKPALGPSFTFLTDTTLWLAKHAPDGRAQNDGTNTYIAEILRCRRARSRTWCLYRLCDGVLLSNSNEV